MTDNIQTVTGTDMIDKEVFEAEWAHFKERFTNSDADMLHGYMIYKAICAILEDAFGIDAPDVSVDKEDKDDV